MTDQTLHGSMNGPSAGIIIKEMVRRATDTIYKDRSTFTVNQKVGYDGVADDMWTSADKAAQELYLKSLRECFPDYGVIAEEDELSIQPQNGCTAFFTVDPLDGTKAYGRKQSHGISTMISLCQDTTVIAAFVGDINAREVYGYRPNSEKVHRIANLNDAELMQRTTPTEPGEVFGLLRDPLKRGYSEQTMTLVESGLFKNYEIMGSSIGTWMARLWKNEVSALLIPPGYETPWDSNPVNGITQALGYRYLRPTEKDAFAWEPFVPEVLTTIQERQHDVLIVHEIDMHHFVAP